MMKNLMLILSLVGIFSCGRQERERLTAQVDSLNYELNESQQATQTLLEVGMLMDSIDASRQLLRSSMVEGTTYNDYVARMTDINNYVKETEKKIADLEKTTKKSMSKANSLAVTIKKLRTELTNANKEMASLQALVAQYKSENGDLVQSISVKDSQLAEREERIRVTQQEMTLLQTNLDEIRTASKQTEADAYYARAQAVEETANRTKFAPRKKKGSRKQARELYKLASLQALVAQYKSENGNLVQSISLKDSQLAEHEERIRVTQQEMTLLQTNLDEIRTVSKQTEADAYYARAQAVEETANRTKFAPRKKKESRKQALELYKLAFQMGKEEAQPKIEELEKKI